MKSFKFLNLFVTYDMLTCVTLICRGYYNKKMINTTVTDSQYFKIYFPFLADNLMSSALLTWNVRSWFATCHHLFFYIMCCLRISITSPSPFSKVLSSYLQFCNPVFLLSYLQSYYPVLLSPSYQSSHRLSLSNFSHSIYEANIQALL